MKKLRFGFKVTPENLSVLDEKTIQHKLYGMSKPKYPHARPTYVRARVGEEASGAQEELFRLRKENKNLTKTLKALEERSTSRATTHAASAKRTFFSAILGLGLFSMLFVGATYTFLMAQGSDASAKVLRAGAKSENAYTLQVAVYNTHDYAEKTSTLLSQQGYPAFISIYYSAYGRPRYRVCVGRYDSMGTAKAALADIKIATAGLFEDGFIRRYSNAL